MTQSRVSGLGILSIENDIAREINKEFLQDFANLKTRRKC